MIVAIPFFPGYTDYQTLTSSINSRGVCNGHHLLVMSRREDEEAAMDFEEGIADNFASSSHKVVDQPQERGRFAVSNEVFRQTLWHLKKYQAKAGEVPEPPLLYFDPALRTSKKAWADTIQSEFFARGMPKVLACQRTRTDGEREIWGAALFTKDFVAESALLSHLPGGVHWRDYLRHEISHDLVISETMFPRGPSSVLSQAAAKTKKKQTEAQA